MVTKDSVYVDGQLVGALSDVIANQGPFFAPLKDALVAQNARSLQGGQQTDIAKREVTIGDRQVELTPKEFDLLRLFASNPGRVFPRKYLLEKIWDYSYEGYDRTIDSHINRLRAKIEENPENPQMVLTVWGIGTVSSLAGAAAHLYRPIGDGDARTSGK